MMRREGMEKDWRLGRDQEEYLKGETLIWKSFKSKLHKDDPYYSGDHYHCEFCWHTFMENCNGMEDCSTGGYCTLDERIWICETCFKDFEKMFNWHVINCELE